MRVDASASSTRAAISARGTRRSRRPNPTFSATVMWGHSAKLWNTIPTLRVCVGRPRISSSSKRIDPASGSTNPAIARSSVVFPQPLGPSSIRSSPLATARLTRSRTVVVSYRTTRSWTVTAAIAR